MYADMSHGALFCWLLLSLVSNLSKIFCLLYILFTSLNEVTKQRMISKNDEHFSRNILGIGIFYPKFIAKKSVYCYVPNMFMFALIRLVALMHLPRKVASSHMRLSYACYSMATTPNHNIRSYVIFYQIHHLTNVVYLLNKMTQSHSSWPEKFSGKLF